MPPEPPSREDRRALVAVERALGEFRRGRPVLLRADGEAAVAVAAEAAMPDTLERLSALGGAATVLALTGSRARALNILPTGHPLILLPLRAWLDAVSLRDLADATTDLAQPMRGPFHRLLRPPSGPERMAVQLAKLARLLPSAVVAPLPPADVGRLAVQEDWLAVDAPAVAAYETQAALQLRPVTMAKLPMEDAEAARVLAFRPAEGGVEHLAIVVGEPAADRPVLVRLHSECFTGDLLGSLKCDCGQQLRGAIRLMAAGEGGILLYLAQEGRGIGLMNKLRAYRLQQDGFDTVDANLRLGFDADERVFLPAAQMLRLMGRTRVRLLTNNPEKVAGLTAHGIEVIERVAHSFPSNLHNEFYLATKRARSGHLL